MPTPASRATAATGVSTPESANTLRAASVLSAYCRHLGTDLARGDVIGDDIRCGFHYWQFGEDGRCSHIPVCDRIPDDAGLFKFPTAESLGLIWAFNGTEATYDVPAW